MQSSKYTDMKILDAHTHLGSYSWSGHSPYFKNARESVDMLMSMGIQGAIFSPIQGALNVTERDLDEANEEALKLYSEFRSFLYPGLSMNPLWRDRSLYWLEVFKKENLKWCGELVPDAKRTGGDFDSPCWDELITACGEAGMIIQVHTTEGVPNAAKKHPDIQFVASHLYMYITKNFAPFSNVMVDISGMNGGLYIHDLRDARTLFGAGRLLFGTDHEGYDPECFIVRCNRIFPEEERRMVFSGNLVKLLNSVHAEPAFLK